MNIPVPSSTLRVGSRTVTILGLSTLATAFSADAFNQGGAQQNYAEAVGGTPDATQAGTQALYGNAQGVSVMVWGPIMAIILGIVVGWMIFAINKGGVFAAINSILALIVGGVAMAVVYTLMIAPS